MANEPTCTSRVNGATTVAVQAGGGFGDIVHWRSPDDARAVLAKVPASSACRAFFAVMDEEDAVSAGCVDHFTSVAVYGRDAAVRF